MSAGSVPNRLIKGVFVAMLLLPLAVAGCSKSDALTTTPKFYKLDALIYFGEGGTSDRYKVTGWSYQERYYTWTEGCSARLQLRVGESHRPLGLRARLVGNVKAPLRPLQPVHLYVNGEKIAEWHIADRVDVNAVIPVDVMKQNGQLDIEFNTPLAIAPRALGISEDPRLLGVAVLELEISKSVNAADVWPQPPQPGG